MTEQPGAYDKTDPGAAPAAEQQAQPAATPQATGLSPEKRKQLYLLGGAAAFLIAVWLFSVFHHSSKQTPPDLATRPVDISGKNKTPETPGLFFHQTKQAAASSPENQASEYDAQLQELQARLKLLQTQKAVKEAEAALNLPASTTAQDRDMMVDLAKPTTSRTATSTDQTGQTEAAQPTPIGAASKTATQPDLVATKENENPAPKDTTFLKSGTFLDAVLVNQLITDNYASPVLVMVDRPYYDPLTKKLLLPAGTRVLGKAEAVKYQTASRLAITFDTFQFPNGTTFHINPDDQALEGLGIFGAKDSINRHTARILLTAGLVGLLTGWNNSQIQGGSYGAYSGNDMMRIQANESMSRTAEQMLSPFLNAMPTITVNAGHRLKIWITRDVALPEYLSSPLE